uniref:Uncharacterized protein n=1 Tax=Anopheles farauti TaxID=69004 RepID=A0A182QIH2_9DIPT
MDDDEISPKSGSGGQDFEMDKSSSTPSDFEVFEYEDIREGTSAQLTHNGSANINHHRRVGTHSSDDENEACGTPLNLELAQLLTQGIVTKAKANFGISKNIETLERSTIELDQMECSFSDHHQHHHHAVPSDSQANGVSYSSSYKRDPDLYLRRSDDDAEQQEQPLPDEEEIDFVQLKNEQLQQQQQDIDSSGQFFEEDEMVFETHTGCTPGSHGGSGFFRYTEPTTSYHSACGGYDNERMMFEGISFVDRSSIVPL